MVIYLYQVCVNLADLQTIASEIIRKNNTLHNIQFWLQPCFFEHVYQVSKTTSGLFRNKSTMQLNLKIGSLF